MLETGCSSMECAEAQLAELDLLLSMFPSEEELEILDQISVDQLRHYVELYSSSSSSLDNPPPLPPPSRPQFLLKHTLYQMEFILSCSYPSDYPKVLPEIAIRCGGLNRVQQTQLQTHLNAHLLKSCQGEVCVLAALDWIKDHLEDFIKTTSPAEPAGPAAQHKDPVGVSFTRLWIYSHHIYNKSKRKNILEWSRELGLSGFSMPGKPGIVCVEGLQSACEDFWSRVKVLTWKKIMIRHREDVSLEVLEDEETIVDSLRKFRGFEEAMFDPHGNRGNHMDLGQLYHFLNEKGCADVFHIYFGIEGK